MRQVIYTSQRSTSLGADDVFGIVQVSARNNTAADITGFLVYADPVFLQLVEGPGAAIEALLARLRTDARHQAVAVLSDRTTAIRNFPHWRMQRLMPGADALGEVERVLRRSGAPQSALVRVRALLHRPAASRPGAEPAAA